MMQLAAVQVMDQCWTVLCKQSAGVVVCLQDNGRDAVSGRSSSVAHHRLPSSSSETDVNVATSSPVASVSICCMIYVINDCSFPLICSLKSVMCCIFFGGLLFCCSSVSLMYTRCGHNFHTWLVCHDCFSNIIFLYLLF